MRIAVIGLLWQSHFLQQLHGHLGTLVVVGADLVDAHGLQQDLADGEAWVERRVGILENDLDAPLVRHEITVGHADDVLAFKQRLSRGGLMQAHQGQADGGLAGAGLAHHAQGLAARQLERHVLHRFEFLAAKQAFAEIEALAQVADVQQDIFLAAATAAAFP